MKYLILEGDALVEKILPAHAYPWLREKDKNGKDLFIGSWVRYGKYVGVIHWVDANTSATHIEWFGEGPGGIEVSPREIEVYGHEGLEPREDYCGMREISPERKLRELIRVRIKNKSWTASRIEDFLSLYYFSYFIDDYTEERLLVINQKNEIMPSESVETLYREFLAQGPIKFTAAN